MNLLPRLAALCAAFNLCHASPLRIGSQFSAGRRRAHRGDPTSAGGGGPVWHSVGRARVPRHMHLARRAPVPGSPRVPCSKSMPVRPYPDICHSRAAACGRSPPLRTRWKRSFATEIVRSTNGGQPPRQRCRHTSRRSDTGGSAPGHLPSPRPLKPPLG